jgi:hypothetical protein
MKTTATLKPGKQLWGIYHTDREYAREMGDPLRTVVEAPNKLIAEETAAQLGFGDPWAHPVNSATELRQAQWLSQTPPRTPARTRAQTISRHPEHLIMQTPSTAQIRTAIEVLKKFGEHINHNAVNILVINCPTHTSRPLQPGRIEARTIEQTRPHRNRRRATGELARRIVATEEAVCFSSCLRQDKPYSFASEGSLRPRMVAVWTRNASQ